MNYDNNAIIFFNRWTDWNLTSIQFTHNWIVKCTSISFLGWHFQFNWEELWAQLNRDQGLESFGSILENEKQCKTRVLIASLKWLQLTKRSPSRCIPNCSPSRRVSTMPSVPMMSRSCVMVASGAVVRPVLAEISRPCKGRYPVSPRTSSQLPSNLDAGL